MIRSVRSKPGRAAGQHTDQHAQIKLVRAPGSNGSISCMRAEMLRAEMFELCAQIDAKRQSVGP